MKKAYRILILTILVFALLFVPIPTERTENGTRVYESLTYAVARWYSYDGTYENTRIYWFPERGIDNLLKLEMDIRNGQWRKQSMKKERKIRSFFTPQCTGIQGCAFFQFIVEEVPV